MTMRAASLILAGAILVGPTGLALAQDTSSWSSGPAKKGETKLLRSERQPQRPAGTSVHPITAQPTGTLLPFQKPATITGSGVFGASIVPRSAGGGNDPAYDAFDQGRYLTAFELATKAAEKGDPQAHTLIGRLYQEGLGVAADPVVAATWYRRGAELGDVEGTFAFAVMLAEGDGLQRNRAGAADLFERAAAQGHVLANYNLGLLYLRGDGKPENPARAALHLRYAAERGIPQAQHDLATLYATGTGVAADAAEAAGWMERAAEQGNVDAQLEFGVWLFQGRGVSASQSRGVLFFRAAAEQGSVVAQNRLARAYAFGAGVPADVEQAALWHLIARAGGLEDARLDEIVKGLPRDKQAALRRQAEEWREAASLR
jgi:TPR repeat protein